MGIGVKPLSYTSRRVLLNRFVCAGMALCGLAGSRDGRAEQLDVPAGLSTPETLGAAEAIDGDTLRLADGRILRLAGIEAPKIALRPGDAALVTLAAQARQSLQAAIGAAPLILRLDTLRRDRYGRLLGQVFAADGAWLQALQVGAGFARVHGDGRNRRGLRALLAAEAPARAARAGLWRHPAFAVRDAAAVDLARFAGSYQIIAGRVAAAAVVKETGFVNFGSERETDLTLVLRKPVLAMMDDGSDPTMIGLDRIAGRLVRCRGWLDLYHGPRIELSHPEQIEILE
jgi:endonuclease YncB( thermonuclease family)